MDTKLPSVTAKMRIDVLPVANVWDCATIPFFRIVENTTDAGNALSSTTLNDESLSAVGHPLCKGLDPFLGIGGESHADSLRFAVRFRITVILSVDGDNVGGRACCFRKGLGPRKKF
jgi:hypothetical protein